MIIFIKELYKYNTRFSTFYIFPKRCQVVTLWLQLNILLLSQKLNISILCSTLYTIFITISINPLKINLSAILFLKNHKITTWHLDAKNLKFWCLTLTLNPILLSFWGISVKMSSNSILYWTNLELNSRFGFFLLDRNSFEYL